MTEVERQLKTALLALENNLAQRLDNQVARLSRQGAFIQKMRQDISQLQKGQEQSTEQLQHLSNVYASLQPLLRRLNALLPDK